MSFFDLFRPKKENPEAKRRAFLQEKGRITDGIILDVRVSDAGEQIASYCYSISGVDFESAEILTEEQQRDLLKYAPGANIGVRFDPRNHGNSILD